MTTQEKTLTLKQQLKDEKVRYSLACGRFSIIPKDSTTVQLVNGGFAKMGQEGVALVRDGGKDGLPMTRAYDPNKSEDKSIIDLVDKWIEDHPEAAKSVDLQLYKMTEFEAVRPFHNWDDLEDLKGMETTLRNLNVDLLRAMKYEEENLARPDVVKLLERLEKERLRAEVDASSEAIDL